MKCVIQRVRQASLSVDGQEVSKINKGLVVFFGVKSGDNCEKIDYFVKKIKNLRVFEDENGKTNLDINQVGGQILFVSQFTLYGDCSHGNRPSFIDAERPERAKQFYELAGEKLLQEGLDVQFGVFGADMQICQINDGPFTIILE